MQAFAKQQGVVVEGKSSDAYVIRDRVLLEQAMFIVLDNSIKYTRLGGRATMHATEQNGQALLEVRDTGIGISRASFPHG